MRSSSRFESLATRFELYVEELHVFLTSCGVSFGTPADVLPFADKLSTPGYLRDGMSAMVRSVIYREQERVSQVELLELVLVAVGGTGVDEDAPEFEQARRKLSRVIGQAMTSLWNMPRMPSQPIGDESGPADPVYRPDLPPPTALPQALPTLSVAEAHASAENGSKPREELTQTVTTQIPEIAIAAPAAPLPPPAVAAPQPMPELPSAPEPAPQAAFIASRLEPMKPPPPAPPPRRPTFPVEVAAPPRLLWVAGLCALLIAPGIDLIAHHRAPSAVHAARPRPHIARPAYIPILQPLPPLSTEETGDAPANDQPFPADALSPRSHRHRSRPAHASASGDAAKRVDAQLPAQAHPDPSASMDSATAVDLPSPVLSSQPTTNQPGPEAPAPTQTPGSPQR